MNGQYTTVLQGQASYFPPSEPPYYHGHEGAHLRIHQPVHLVAGQVCGEGRRQAQEPHHQEQLAPCASACANGLMGRWVGALPSYSPGLQSLTPLAFKVHSCNPTSPVTRAWSSAVACVARTHPQHFDVHRRIDTRAPNHLLLAGTHHLCGKGEGAEGEAHVLMG